MSKKKEDHKTAAPNLRDKNPTVKEYIGEDDKHYLIIGNFPDGSGIALRKKKSEDTISVAEYKFCEKGEHKNILKKINSNLSGPGHTYDKIKNLLNDYIETE